MTNQTNSTTTTKLSKPKPKPTREALLSKLLARKFGATIAQIQEATGWQPHTARAAISRLRKAGIKIERKDSDMGSVYRIVVAGSRK